MKSILVAQQKGGVGKTACAAHIAWHAADRGLRVVAIDLDTGNLSSTLRAHKTDVSASALFEAPAISSGHLAAKHGLALIAADARLADLPLKPIGHSIENCRANMEQLADAEFDVCVVDTPPSMGVQLAAALHAVDGVITPVEVEGYSIQGVGDMMKAILNARVRNPKLTFLGLVPSRVDRRNPRHVAHLQQLKHQHENLLAPVVVGLRSSIADALAQGTPVWTSRKTTARAAAVEMRALGDYVLAKMGVQQ